MTATEATSTRGFWAAVDERFGLGALAYEVPKHANTLPYSLGGISLVSLFVLIVSGVLLTQFYYPLPEFANESVRTMMSQFGLASLVRGVHYWAAQAFLVAVLLHLIRIFATASFKRPREGNWVVGVLLLAIAIGLYFSGTVLKWDQEAFEALEHNLVVGHLLGGLWHWFAPAFSQAAPLLLRLYVAHIVVLPATIFFVLVVHFWLIKKHGISPIPGRPAGPMLSFTSHLAHLGKYAAVLVGLFLIFAVLRPPAVGPAPVEGIEVTKPPWPFLPLFAVENWVGVPGLLWVSLAAFILLALVPLLDRSPSTRPSERRAVLVLASIFLLLLVGLALLAWLTKGVEHIGTVLSNWT